MTLSVGEVADLAKENPREYRQITREYFSYIDPTHLARVTPLLKQLSGKFARMNLRTWSHQFQTVTVRTMSLAPTFDLVRSQLNIGR